MSQSQEDRLARAREALHICEKTRRAVDAFLGMSEREQEEQHPEEIAQVFEHLWSCDNAWAFQEVAGNASGSGLCGKKWAQVKKLRDEDPQNFHWPAIDHMARIESPQEWAWILRARERQWGTPEMTPHYKFMHEKLKEWEQNSQKKGEKT